MNVGDLVKYNEKTLARHIGNVMLVVDMNLDHRQTSVTLMMPNGRFVEHVWVEHLKIVSKISKEEHNGKI